MILRTAVGFLLMLALLASAASAWAWGPAGHAVIALGVAQEQQLTVPDNYLLLQAVYGSSAPDFAWGALEPLQSALGAATHDAPGFLRPWDLAGTRAQRAFAWGWVTHNQSWGADYYAHLAGPLASDAPGYVEGRAALLAVAQGIDTGTAHDFVEVGIDLLLDQEHPELGLGRLLSRAASSRDSRLPRLLTSSYSGVPGANWLTISSLESAFRAGMIAYGAGLALPSGADDAAFVSAMAPLYGLSLSESGACLATAKALCLYPGARYDDAIASTIALISAAPWPALP